jgi:hypothetical protein
MAFAQMILDAIITSQHHAGHQAQHFLGLDVQCPFLIGIGVEVPQAFHHQIALAQDDIIHPFSVFIEFVYDTHVWVCCAKLQKRIGIGWRG